MDWCFLPGKPGANSPFGKMTLRTCANEGGTLLTPTMSTAANRCQDGKVMAGV